MYTSRKLPRAVLGALGTGAVIAALIAGQGLLTEVTQGTQRL